MATSLKADALPLLDLLDAALGRPLKLHCLEDNTQCIAAVRNGYSPAVRHLSRTERISLGVLHEHFVEQSGIYELQYQPTKRHKGDVFTKKLEPASFEAAVPMMGLRKIIR